MAPADLLYTMQDEGGVGAKWERSESCGGAIVKTIRVCAVCMIGCGTARVDPLNPYRFSRISTDQKNYRRNYWRGLS